MAMSKPARHFYEFGPFRIDVAERVLLRDGHPVPLTPKAFDTLLVLVERNGHIVDKDDIMREVWPDTFVEEGNLARHVSTLRKVLGDSADGDRYIETIPKRGYRFGASVRELMDDETELILEKRTTSQVAIREQEENPAHQEEKAGEAIGGAGAQTASASQLRRFSARAAVPAIAVLIFIVAAAVIYSIISREAEPGGEPAIKSIAVLPLKSFSADGDDEYLGIGIAETLTTRLSSLRLLTVRPPSAAFKYTATEDGAVRAGRELGVESVLEGSVRRSGGRVRVTVALVSVQDGSLLWAENFDEEVTDIFKVEDAISARVAEALALKLSGEDQKLLTKRYTHNADAYQLYLKGRYFWNKRTEDGFKRGIAHFEQAVEKDPGYALAYAGLADSYIGLTFYSFASPHEAMPRAKQAATRALEIDDMLAEAHASLAHVRVNYDWDWPDAEKEFKRSIDLNPDYATAHQWYAVHYLTATEQMELAILEIKRARELEPTSLVMNTFLASTLYFAGRYDEAIEQCKKTLEMDPNFAVARWHLGLAYGQKNMFDEAIGEFQRAIELSGGSPLMKAALGHAYARAGRTSEAIKLLNELKELSARRYVSAFGVAAIHAALGNDEQAFQWLERSYHERSFHLVSLKVWPEFAHLRSDPRFRDLVRRLGLLH